LVENEFQSQGATVHHLFPHLTTAWIQNFIATFEEGRVQKHPEARFVNARGECCLVAALAGARSVADVVRSPVWRAFLNSPLEELSRGFEARRWTGQEFYEASLLALVERRAVAERAFGVGVG
jgi:hypothetical protein